MRTTAVLNLKGGVAKTTTVVNMAAILAAKHKKRVLVVDADPQANTTEFFGGVPHGYATLSDMLRVQNRLLPNIAGSNFPGVDLLAADDSLMDLDLSKVEGNLVNVVCLKQELTELKYKYDFVLIDCPPAFNAASAAALLAADDVLIPMKLDAFSLRGMSNLLRQIQNMRKINRSLKIAGLLPTMSYKSDNIQEAIKQLRASKLNVFSPIRRTGKVDDMTFEQAPLITSSPKSAACIDYKRFVLEYMRGGLKDGI